ncbi:signal peptide-containing secreted insulinase-like peptidase [Cryptosporidium canis]|uniref:Signal peptide-containing secreted insulinase-like peptidase n=1 Tax=Cryptosporidium canis TaxID=195482 RepID=A0A9D5HUK8_9CRYT|nr:signal peptide-containing secreted insulinase-like peptidase [Cryptosporidium canis]
MKPFSHISNLLLYIALVPYISRQLLSSAVLPVSFAEISSEGNVVPKKANEAVASSRNANTEDPDIVFETSVYVPSVEMLKDQSFKIVKLSNKVEVILNSVPKMDRCEISVINRVGSICEPTELQGLGFYLMNVLVSGSVSDPRRGLIDFSMDNSISLSYEPHSIYSIFNIVTTPFLFESTLSILSEMFKNPVISEETMEKALNLLEKKSMENSSRNFFEELILSDPRSNFSRNKYGDRRTLKTVPASKKIDMKQSLVQLFNEQYSSNRLIVAMRCRYPLNAMQDLAKNYLLGIPNKNLPLFDQHKPFSDLYVNPFSHSAGMVLFNIEKSSSVLKLVFPLKNFILPYMKSDPLFFIRAFICENRDFSLMRYLSEKGYVSRVDCSLVNSSYGFTNLHFHFHMNNKGSVNIHNILRSFFYSVSRIKDLKLDLGYYKRVRQEYLSGLKSSKRFLDGLSSTTLVNNFFRYKSSTFNSIIFGANEYSDFDLNLHRQILFDIKPENLIMILNLCRSQVEIEDAKALAQFDQSISNKDCSLYEKFLENQKSFSFIALTNVVSTEFSGVQVSDNNHEYVLEKLNWCLQRYFSSFPESLSDELKIHNLEVSSLKPLVNTDSYRKVMKQMVPMKLSDLLTIDPSKRAPNFAQFKDFYYFIPHASPTSKIHLAVNLFFPFEDEAMASIRSARIAAILLIFKEVLMSHNESLASRFSKFNAEFTPSVKFPKDSVVNVFGLSMILSSVPEAFSKLIETFASNVKNYINLDANTFQQFLDYYKSYLTSLVEKREPRMIYSDFINQLNANHNLSTDAILNELQTLTVEEMRQVLGAMFKLGRASGVIYGNLNPGEAEAYLSKFFAETIEETPQRSSRLNRVSRSILRSKLKSSRMLSKIGTKRNKSKISLTKKRNKLTLKKRRRTAKANESDKIEDDISSRSDLYKLYSSKLSKSGSETCKNLQVIDMSSMKPSSKFFFHSYSDKVTQNISVLWIYIDQASPESFVFVEYLKHIINNRLTAEQGRYNNIKVAVKNHDISPSSYFISIEGLSDNENFSQMNDLLSSYIDKFLSPNSLISSEPLFSSAKEYLLRKFEKEGVVNDAQLSSIFEEISNQRFDFVRFRSISKLLNGLTFVQFISNLEKIYKSTFSIMLSISMPDSQPSLPNGFTGLTNIGDIFKRSGVRTFSPKNSRLYKKLSKIQE